MTNRIILPVLLIALSFHLRSQDLEEVSLSAFGVYQDVKVDFDKETRFKIIASVKAEIIDKSAWAGLFASVADKGESYGFYDNMSDRPIKSNDWAVYEINGTVNQDSDTLSFGVQGFYTGIFSFDNIQLLFEENGAFVEYSIPNPDFEELMVDNVIPAWDQYYIDERHQKPKSIDVRTDYDRADNNTILVFDASKVRPPVTIGESEGVSPQIGTLITMLDDLKNRVFDAVETLDLEETDYLLDEKANRIGALVMHLVAAEKYYQVLTFEGRSFNEEETEKWQMALDLGDTAREVIKDKPIDFYLDLYEETRKETIRLLKTKNDKWLEENVYPTVNNHFCWFHVMEHQASHLGQIYFLKKRMPENEEIKN